MTAIEIYENWFEVFGVPLQETVTRNRYRIFYRGIKMEYWNTDLHISLTGIFTIHKNAKLVNIFVKNISCYVNNRIFFHEKSKSNRVFNKKTKFIKYHRGFFRFKVKDIIEIRDFKYLPNHYIIMIYFNNKEQMELEIGDECYKNRIIEQIKTTKE